jgi:flagellar protein FlgJ
MNVSALTPLAPASDARPVDEKAMQTAREFESLFLAQFAQVMFQGIKSDGPFGGGPAEDIFKNLLAEEYGKTLARSGGVGIADSVYREILKFQEAA